MDSRITFLLYSAGVMLTLVISLLCKTHRNPSTRAYTWVCGITMLACLNDTLMYLEQPAWMPHGLFYGLLLFGFLIGDLILISFFHYSYCYISSKMRVDRRYFLLPCVCLIIGMIFTLAAGIEGTIFQVVDGRFQLTGSKPLVPSIIEMICILYAPGLAIVRHKRLGFKAVFLLGLFGLAPLVSWTYFVPHGGSDYTYVCTAIALFVMYIFLVNAMAFEQERLLRRKVERARQRAERANAAKTRFLFNMSHDIRTPMNAIVGFSKLIRNHIDDPVKVNDYLYKIDNSSQYLLSLINNVLEMSRIESGKIKLNPQPILIEQFEADVHNMIIESVKGKNINYTSDTQVTVKAVMGDILKFKEIYVNLISNAVKYTP